MTRTTYLLAGVGLVLLPVGATAFGWRSRYVQPVGPVYAPPEVVFLSPCPPAVPIYPLVECPPASAAPAQAAPANPPKVMEKEKEKSAAPPAAEPNPIRPAAFSQPTPADQPAEKPPFNAPRPNDLPTAPKPDPTGERPMATIPKPDVPAAPPQETRKPDTPAQPDPLKIELPPAAGGPGTPPLVIPKVGDDKKPDGLKIPELPGAGSTSNYPPSGRRAGVSLIPVEGPKPAGGWSVGFFNYTAADVTLTVNGKGQTLPAKSSVSVPVDAKFTWKVSGGAEETATIPADAGGFEVVIK